GARPKPDAARAARPHAGGDVPRFERRWRRGRLWTGGRTRGRVRRGGAGRRLERGRGATVRRVRRGVAPRRRRAVALGVRRRGCAPGSCARRRRGRRATDCARSSTKSATSLSSPSNPSRSRSSRWAWGVGLAVTVALLAWVLRGVALREVVAHARRADPLLLLATVAIATATFPLRTIRWRLILRDVDGQRFAWTPLWHATAIGFMANSLLPA